MPNWNEVIVEIQQEQKKNPNLNPLKYRLKNKDNIYNKI